MYWYLEVLKKYAVFSGRARRREYWFFFLFNALISLALASIDNSMGMLDASVGLGVLGGLYTLAVMLPSVTVGVRRLHDTGRSGWWILISLVPIVGAIVLVIFLATSGQEGDNQFGPDPKVDVGFDS